MFSRRAPAGGPRYSKLSTSSSASLSSKPTPSASFSLSSSSSSSSTSRLQLSQRLRLSSQAGSGQRQLSPLVRCLHLLPFLLLLVGLVGISVILVRAHYRQTAAVGSAQPDLPEAASATKAAGERGGGEQQQQGGAGETLNPEPAKEEQTQQPEPQQPEPEQPQPEQPEPQQPQPEQPAEKPEEKPAEIPEEKPEEKPAEIPEEKQPEQPQTLEVTEEKHEEGWTGEHQDTVAWEGGDGVPADATNAVVPGEDGDRMEPLQEEEKTIVVTDMRQIDFRWQWKYEKEGQRWIAYFAEWREAPWLRFVGDWFNTNAEELLPKEAHEKTFTQRCPNDCSGRGTCNAQDDVCYCRLGYTGSDCASEDDFPCNLPKPEGDDGGLYPFGIPVSTICAAECDHRTARCYCGANSKYPTRPAVAPCGFVQDDNGPQFNKLDLESLYSTDPGSPGWCNADVTQEARTMCFNNYDGANGAFSEIPVAAFCINQCSLKGDCVQGACQCRDGWYGIDCSIPSVSSTEIHELPPWLEPIKGEMQKVVGVAPGGGGGAAEGGGTRRRLLAAGGDADDAVGGAEEESGGEIEALQLRDKLGEEGVEFGGGQQRSSSGRKGASLSRRFLADSAAVGESEGEAAENRVVASHAVLKGGKAADLNLEALDGGSSHALVQRRLEEEKADKREEEVLIDSVHRPNPLFYVYDLPPKFTSTLIEGRHWKYLCAHRLYTDENETYFNNEWPFGHETAILEAFLNSPQRTNNVEEAHYFVVPLLTACLLHQADESPRRQINADLPEMRVRPHLVVDYALEVLDWIKKEFGPYWERYDGHDHIWIFSAWEGSCHAPNAIRQSIFLTPFGNTMEVHNGSFTSYAPDDWAAIPKHKRGDEPCYDFNKDIVVPALKDPTSIILEHVTRPLKDRNIFFFFKGDLGNAFEGGREEEGFSLGIRQTVAKYFSSIENKNGQKGEKAEDDVIVALEQEVEPANIGEEMSRARFCGVFPGDGFSGHFEEAMIRGCIPVVIQDGIHLPWEGFLDYASFAIRIKEEDIPDMIKILRGIPDSRVRKMLDNVRRIWQRFTYRSVAITEADRRKTILKGQDPPWAPMVRDLNQGEDDAIATLFQVLTYKFHTDV